MNSQVVLKMPSRSQQSVSVLSFFARLFNSAKTATFLLSIICLGGLLASPAEAAVYAQGTFTANTTSVNVGFKPRAVIFYWSNQTGTGFVANDSAIGMGFAANNDPGGIQQAVLAIGADDGVLPTNTASSNRTDSAILIKTNGNSTAGSISAEAVLSSFTATGFTLNWTGSSSASIQYIALDETEFTNAKVGNSSWASGVTGNQDVTTVGFQPDFVMTLGSDRGDSLTADSADSAINIGLMSDSSTVQQATLGYGGRDNLEHDKSNYSTGHVLRNTDISFMYRNTVDSIGSFVGMLTNGFRISFSNAAGGAQNFHYLALEGGLHDIDLTTKRSGTGSQTVTGVGFEPKGLMFLSNNDTVPSRSNNSPNTSKVSIGAASPTSESSIWFQDRYICVDDCGDASDVYMGMQTDKAILMREQSGTDGLADLTSMDADGFTLNWTTSDTSARRFVYWAVGSAVVPNSAPTIDTTAPSPATEDTLYSYTPTVTDSDGPTTNWTVEAADTCGGSFTGGTYSFTPAGPTPAADCVLDIQVCDGGDPDECATETTTVTITAVNDTPTITSTASTSATEDTLYSYTPTLNDPDGPAINWTVLGTDTCGGSFTSGTYNFTPAGPAPPASCQLDIQLCDGGTPDLCATETRTVTITAVDDPSTLTISEPSGQAVTVGTSFDITYTLSDPEGSATVTFYYDTIGSGFSGTAISGCANQIAGSDQTCTWDTNGMSEGTYHVFGVPSDSGSSAYSAGQITINPAGAALLAVFEPNGTNDTIAEGASFTVNYYLEDTNDLTTASFFYDTDGDGAGGTLIDGCSNQPEATNGTCVWNASGVDSGSYYIYGTTSGDGAGDVTVVSSGTMTINHAPALSISEPNGSGDTVSAGSVYNITYTLTDANDTATVALYYDSDNAGFNGTPISGCGTAAMGSGVTCAWDTSLMATGDYYIYGIATDTFSGTAQVYSPGVITITPNVAATLVVNQPDGAGTTITTGVSFTINYDLTDSDDVTTVAFFYDINNSGADGTAIGGCAAEPEATGGTCSWSTAGIESGSYYVYATTSGDEAGAATVYSLGTVTINATPFSYADGDDGTNPWSGDSIAGISRSDGGDDSSNLESGKPKIDIEYEFRINFIDDSAGEGQTPQLEPMLYIAHRDSPTEGADGDFFVYPLTCTGATWGSGKTCSTTMKLGPVASHTFYFYAKKNDGTVISSGYIDGPQIQLIEGYSLAGVPRDIDSSNYDGYAAFYTQYAYGWSSLGLDTAPGNFNGTWGAVTFANPAKAGRGYFIYKWWADTLPQLESDPDVTAPTHTISLQTGWNLISNPYNGNVKLSDVQIRQNDTTTDTWSNAAGSNWIESAIYYYRGSDWGGTFAPELAELVPWMGYWMYVKDNANSYKLIVTQPAQ